MFFLQGYYGWTQLAKTINKTLYDLPLKKNVDRENEKGVAYGAHVRHGTGACTPESKGSIHLKFLSRYLAGGEGRHA